MYARQNHIRSQATIAEFSHHCPMIVCQMVACFPIKIHDILTMARAEAIRSDGEDDTRE